MWGLSGLSELMYTSTVLQSRALTILDASAPPVATVHLTKRHAHTCACPSTRARMQAIAGKHVCMLQHAPIHTPDGSANHVGAVFREDY